MGSVLLYVMLVTMLVVVFVNLLGNALSMVVPAWMVGSPAVRMRTMSLFVTLVQGVKYVRNVRMPPMKSAVSQLVMVMVI